MAHAALCCCSAECCGCGKAAGARMLETGTTPTEGWGLCGRFWLPPNKPSPIYPIWVCTIEIFAAIPLYFAWPVEHPPKVTCPKGILFYRVLAGIMAANIVFAIVQRFRQRRLFTRALSADDLMYANRMKVILLDFPGVYAFIWLMLLQALWLIARDFILGSKERSFNTCTGAAPVPSISILVFQWAFIVGTLVLFAIILVIQMTITGDKVSRLGGRTSRGLAPMGMAVEVTPFDDDYQSPTADLEDELLPPPRGGAGAGGVGGRSTAVHLAAGIPAHQQEPVSGLAQLEAATHQNRNTRTSFTVSPAPPRTRGGAGGPTTTPPPRPQQAPLESSRPIEW